MMTSARPETLEACWSLIEMMDREVVGAQEDEARAKAEVKRLRDELSWRPAAGCSFDSEYLGRLVDFFDAERTVYTRTVRGESSSVCTAELDAFVSEVRLLHAEFLEIDARMKGLEK